MTNLTIRLDKNIDDRLSNISEITNIPKSSLILYALNDFFRHKLDIETVDVNSSSAVRTTIRINSFLEESFLQATRKNNFSKNGIVNFIVQYYIENVWNY